MHRPRRRLPSTPSIRSRCWLPWCALWPCPKNRFPNRSVRTEKGKEGIGNVPGSDSSRGVPPCPPPPAGGEEHLAGGVLADGAFAACFYSLHRLSHWPLHRRLLAPPESGERTG